MTAEDKQKYKEYQKNIVRLKNNNVIILIFLSKTMVKNMKNL